MILIVFILSFLFHVGFFGAGASIHTQELASESISLANRYPNRMVNEVFKDNILITLAYMRQANGEKVNTELVDKPLHYSFVLRQNDVFAFHDVVLPAYEGKVTKTTHAHFNAQEGFKSDGYLMGDGVCHLASLMNYAASNAGLLVEAPTNHDFATIPQVPKKYGVSIYTSPSEPWVSAKQNLYITNSLDHDVIITFDYQNENLTVRIAKIDA